MALPNNILIKVFDNVKDIDTRLAFGIPPRRLRQRRIRRYKVIYDNTNNVMYDFTGMSDPDPYWIVRRGIKFEYYRTPGLYVFNMGWEDYDMTMYSEKGPIGPTPCSNHIVFSEGVKFINHPPSGL